jgi:hypothetical protein
MLRIVPEINHEPGAVVIRAGSVAGSGHEGVYAERGQYTEDNDEELRDQPPTPSPHLSDSPFLDSL